MNVGFLFQSSEFAKLAVIVWTAMLIVKKGDKLRRLTKGLLPFMVVLGVLDLLVILEPDLSMAMMFTLIMGIMLFAGGVRIGHSSSSAIIAIPLLWHEVEQRAVCAAAHDELPRSRATRPSRWRATSSSSR